MVTRVLAVALVFGAATLAVVPGAQATASSRCEFVRWQEFSIGVNCHIGPLDAYRVLAECWLVDGTGEHGWFEAGPLVRGGALSGVVCGNIPPTGQVQFFSHDE